jgi:muramoyltetrapeptide carboxypeptidase
MLYTLQRSGQLSQLKGLLVGSFTDIEDTERPFGQSVQEVIWDKVAGYGYPVCFNMPCGHQYDNRALRLGMPYELIVTEEKAVLSSI